MAATNQISVTSGSPTAITALSYCKQVRVAENKGVVGWPTTDYLIKKPTSNATPVRVGAGDNYTFISLVRWYSPGQIVGYIQTVTGTTTFDQDEDEP